MCVFVSKRTTRVRCILACSVAYLCSPWSVRQMFDSFLNVANDEPSHSRKPYSEVVAVSWDSCPDMRALEPICYRRTSLLLSPRITVERRNFSSKLSHRLVQK